jgi:hypothetical protein
LTGGQNGTAGQYDREVELARLFHWDYWQVQALPGDYLDELMIALEVDRTAETIKAEAQAVARARAANVAKMRAANLAILHKQGLKPLQ